ncbi:MAG: hypothetical protein AB8H47_31275 [Bacteroidia bacterium]
MSFSIKTILKLICFLGLFVCVSKSADAQNTIVDITGDFGRTDSSFDRIIKNPAELQTHFEQQSQQLILKGLPFQDVRSITLVGLSGERILLETRTAQQGVYHLPILKSDYYVLVIESSGKIVTKNIHLRH